MPRVKLHPLFPTVGRLVAAAALLALVGSLASCAKAPFMGKGSLKVSLTATTYCNSCGKPAGYPLTYRVLQVTDASVVKSMTLTQLWDKEEKLLGPALLDKKEAFIDPGQSKDLVIEKKPGATAMSPDHPWNAVGSSFTAFAGLHAPRAAPSGAKASRSRYRGHVPKRTLTPVEPAGLRAEAS